VENGIGSGRLLFFTSGTPFRMVILSPTTVGVATFGAHKTIFPFQILQQVETALFIRKSKLKLLEVLLCHLNGKPFYFFYLIQSCGVYKGDVV
jgi:hypothetical protein